MKKYMIKLNGKEYEVEIEEVTEEQMSPVISSASEPTPAVGNGEPVVAPMPGNILAIQVELGKRVKKGQTLVILEAMKMENEIVAPVDGVVTNIAISKGQTIETGAPLVHIA